MVNEEWFNKGILTKEQWEAGIRLMGDDHIVTLYFPGGSANHYNSARVTVERLREDAQKWLQQNKIKEGVQK